MGCFYYVDAAFFGVGVGFPPPAACSDVFTGFDGSGAWRAAELWVALIVQFVIGNFVFFDEFLNLLKRPVG